MTEPTHFPTPSGGHSFVDRVMGSLRLDAATYDEIEHDPDALPQAAGVVALAALCAGIGGATAGGAGIVGGVLSAAIGWLLSAGVVWLVGVKMLDHTSDYPELLRTLGFASAPQLALVLAFLPVVGWFVRIAVAFWGLAAYVIAVRQALDVSTQRAIVVCLLAWGLTVLLAILLGGLFGGLF